MEEDDSLRQAYDLGVELLKNNAELQPEDSIQRAWNFVVDWIAANRDYFDDHMSQRFGAISGDKVLILPSKLREALEQAGFSYTKCIRGFVSRGWFDSHTDTDGKKRNQFQCRINGINARVFRCNLKVVREHPFGIPA